MNLILLPGRHTRVVFGPDSRVGRHLSETLKPRPGQKIDVGQINGPRGKARVQPGPEARSWALEITWGDEPPPSEHIDLFVGLPRPQTARKLLQAAPTLGIRSLCFFASEKGEPSYGRSKLWTSDEWSRHLYEGAEQAFTTRIPSVRHSDSLAHALALLEGHSPDPTRIALDNYEANGRLAAAPPWSQLALALGPERGFSNPERQRLRDSGFSLLSLGERVLRLEVALPFALGVADARKSKTET